MRAILYISYDSITDAISKSQTIPLLNEYTKLNKVYLISFEKKPNEAKKNRNYLNKEIKWHYIKFETNLILKLFSLITCKIKILKILLFNKIDIIQTRSYVPTIFILIPKLFIKFKLIFDIRGFWFDEKFEAGHISSLNYNILKILEKFLFNVADEIITLSHISKEIISKDFMVDKKKIHVIPTFTNFKKFKNDLKTTPVNKIIFGYVGNIGMNYEFNKIISFFEYFDKINNNWELIIANNQINKIPLIEKLPFKKKIKLKKVKFLQMNKFYSKIDLCIYFLNKKFSKKASCPTKLGELIATNTPFITNSKIGDINQIILKIKIKEFLIDKINISKIIKINKIILKIKNKESKYNSRLKLKHYFDENLNLDKYNAIVQNFKK